LLTMRALLLRHGEQRAGRPHHPWPMQGWALPRALPMLEELPLGIIDADPISAVPSGAEDLVRDQPQIDLAPGGPETSGA
jgi:hypothetical protein